MIDVPPITTAAITASSLPVPTDWSSVEVPWAIDEAGAEPDQQPGQEVGQQHPALHADPGEPGGVRVAADGVEVPTARGVPQVPPGERGDQHGDRERVRDAERATLVAAAEDLERRRDAVDRARAEELQAQEQEQVRRAERDDDRVHPAVGDQQPVDQAEHAADRDRQQHRDRAPTAPRPAASR